VLLLLPCGGTVAAQQMSPDTEPVTKPADESGEADRSAEPPEPAESAEPAEAGPLVGDEETGLTAGGYLRIRATVYGEAENGLRQQHTDDRAVQSVSGFGFHRARLYAQAHFMRRILYWRMQLKLEGSPGLMDAYLAWDPLDRRLVLQAGQMKIPSSYEVGVSAAELDFAERANFSRYVAGFSLSRAVSANSPFSGVRTYLRDLGVGLRGELYGWRYHLMVGNGLGANLFISDRDHKEWVIANQPGAFFYGARLSFDPLDLVRSQLSGFPLQSIRFGGHACTNRHPDIVLQDERTVADLRRRSWSADVQVDFFRRLRLTGMLGAGVIEDDADFDDNDDLTYAGYEIKAVVVILPGLLEAGYRWDLYRTERAASGAEEDLMTHTGGVTVTPESHVRIQAEAGFRELDSPINPDLDDNLFVLTGQFRL
jgi:hypothetical protein